MDKIYKRDKIYNKYQAPEIEYQCSYKKEDRNRIYMNKLVPIPYKCEFIKYFPIIRAEEKKDFEFRLGLECGIYRIYTKKVFPDDPDRLTEGCFSYHTIVTGFDTVVPNRELYRDFPPYHEDVSPDISDEDLHNLIKKESQEIIPYLLHKPLATINHLGAIEKSIPSQI